METGQTWIIDRTERAVLCRWTPSGLDCSPFSGLLAHCIPSTSASRRSQKKCGNSTGVSHMLHHSAGRMLSPPGRALELSTACAKRHGRHKLPLCLDTAIAWQASAAHKSTPHQTRSAVIARIQGSPQVDLMCRSALRKLTFCRRHRMTLMIMLPVQRCTQPMLHSSSTPLSIKWACSLL